jgi:glycerophosphoryl diester phosphodiesterase
MGSRIRSYSNIGHRGAPVLVPPGNTLASLRKALDVGAQMLEVDVRRTRDDVLVINHDAVRMVAGQETALEALTYAEWQAYTEDTEAPLTALEPVFDLVARSRAGLMLDFKEPGTEALVARAVRASGLPMERILIAGASESSRRILRALDPRIPLSLSLGSESTATFDANFLAEIDTDAVTWHHRLFTAGIVKALLARDLRVYAWTVNLTEDMRRLRAMGVTGIITDSPDLLRLLG